MERDLKLFAYGISDDPDEVDSGQHYNDELVEVLSRTYSKVQKRRIKNRQELHKLIKKYPNVPAFKNYLVVYYQLAGEQEQAYKANRALVKQHPDYLFGKLNLCAEYLEKDELDEIPKVLGVALDLKDLYPNREVFHTTEFSAFLNVSCEYLIADGNSEAARTRIEVASKFLGKDHPVILKLNRLLMAARLEANQNRHKAALERRNAAYERLEDASPLKPIPQTTEPPTFHHQEIWQLYENGLDVNPDVLKEILALPRTTLIEDLEKMLVDAFQRFDFFEEKIEEEDSWQKHSSFPLHALALLTDLDAKEKLSTIIHHLSQNKKYLDFYYGDHLYETIWIFIYRLANQDMATLKTYLIDCLVTTKAKTPILQAVHQIAWHQPERKTEVKSWLHNILEYFSEHLDDALVADEEIITHIVGDLANLGAQESLPLIQTFFALDLVDPMMSGDYEDIEKDILKGEPYERQYKLHPNIFELYNHILKTWSGYMSEEELEAERIERQKRLVLWEEENLRKETPKILSTPSKKYTPVQPKPKVGRNEPCPCGSGKKYKKCCINK